MGLGESFMEKEFRIGLARMHVEAGERRDFLPDFVAQLEKYGAQVVLEQGYGSGMGLHDADYQSVAPGVSFASHEDIYQQDYVLVLRCPSEDHLRRLRSGACLISMLHYPTRPKRVDFLNSLGIEAISLDSLKDDSGRRIVENLRAVAWNGVEVAFQTLRTIYPAPGFESPQRKAIHVTLMGAGAVGMFVMQAAIRYGNEAIWRDLAARGVPGAQVLVVDYDTTTVAAVMQKILAETDVLVDATQRPDPSHVVIPNEWIACMPEHAVLLDLSVDPYQCNGSQRIVKGIEGIPQGNLDQYIFRPDDPAYQHMPSCVNAVHRRFAVSCYSWPGIHPRDCMKIYGHQLRPIIRNLIEKGGVENIDPKGRFFERAIHRAMLSRWNGG
jgi:alanine dehydrogenase